jgi:hypothetical protein
MKWLLLKITIVLFIVVSESAKSQWFVQNAPDPFNPVTTIKYSAPDAGTSLIKFLQLKVWVKVFNTISQEAATLVNEQQTAGRYEFKFDGGGKPSGVYVYRLSAGNYSAARKLVLLN